MAFSKIIQFKKYIILSKKEIQCIKVLTKSHSNLTGNEYDFTKADNIQEVYFNSLKTVSTP